MAIPLTQEQRDGIVRGRKEGLNNSQTAEKVGVSVATVSRVVREAGLANGTTRAAKLMKRRKTIVRLRNKGMSAVKIAEKMGIHVATVYSDQHIMGTGKDYPSRMSKASRNGHRTIQPIVLGAETGAETDGVRYGRLLDHLWAKLSNFEKLRAIEGLNEREDG